MKTCKKCGNIKPLTEFYTDNSASDKLTRYCKICCKAAEKDYHKRNPAQKKFRNKKNMLVDGKPITAKIFNSMLAEQQNKCGICSDDMHSPCIDHDHKTNKVRMLLCQHCNSLLGMAKEDPVRLQKAIEYIGRFM